VTIPMNEESDTFIVKLQKIIDFGFQNAAKGLSGMVGTNLTFSQPEVKSIPLQEIPYCLGGPENDAVGIYLRMEGELSGQVMLLFPLEKAYELVDLLMELDFGTTQELGSMEKSALAEVGNLTGTFFMNSISELTGIPTLPTPPAVMVDMVGSIIDVVIAQMGKIEKNVLMFQTSFVVGDRRTAANFWIVPDPGTLNKMIEAGSN
jgi:chemotaxis protein CheC